MLEIAVPFVPPFALVVEIHGYRSAVDKIVRGGTRATLLENPAVDLGARVVDVLQQGRRTRRWLGHTPSFLKHNGIISFMNQINSTSYFLCPFSMRPAFEITCPFANLKVPTAKTRWEVSVSCKSTRKTCKIMGIH